MFEGQIYWNMRNTRVSVYELWLARTRIHFAKKIGHRVLVRLWYYNNRGDWSPRKGTQFARGNEYMPPATRNQGWHMNIEYSHETAMNNVVTWQSEKGMWALLCDKNAGEEYAPSGTESPHAGVQGTVPGRPCDHTSIWISRPATQHSFSRYLRKQKIPGEY